MDDSGLTYSLEAMLGILLIAGVVVFVAANPPPIAEHSGKYSKIQLVNLGEDILSLIASAPFRDTGVNETALYNNVSRNYTLVANKTNVAIGEAVGFKVYYPGNGGLVNDPLNYSYSCYPGTCSGGSGAATNGTFNLPFNDEEKEYQVQVRSSVLSSNVSNNVTIYVGYYLLLLNAYGIGVNDTVRGVVTKNGSGIDNLTINVYDASMILKNNTNRTQEGGRFLLKWDPAWGSWKFYINASNGTYNSNLQELNVTVSPVVLSGDKNHVFETRNVTANLTNSSGGMAGQSSSFFANDQGLNNSKIEIADIGNGMYNLTFKRAGSYIIQYRGGENSNPVLVNVHTMESYLASPLSYFLGTEYLRLGDLKELVGPFIPANMDYNLYLFEAGQYAPIDELFPGKVPSQDAVVVSRIVRSDAIEGTGIVRELRIVLWYR